jgi:hypothetical protein
MSGQDVAWTTAAATGLGCALTATVVVWMLLTDPLAFTAAVGTHDVAALAETAAHVLRDVAVRLLH